MLLVVSALLAASVAPAATAPAQPAPAPVAKPKRVCHVEEAVTGSITPKRVCVTVPAASPTSQGQEAARDKSQQPQATGSGSNN
jgi:curli biogenesis system outer membrane secretion channel CsgG